MYDHYDYLEAALSRTEARLDSAEGALARESEAQAADAERRDRHTVRVREVASPAFGRALGDALFGRTVRVRETEDSLGNRLLTGPHSHGSTRHVHDRLPGPHTHCRQCGSDDRLCVDNPHHVVGPTAVREASTSSPAAFGARVGDLLFEDTGPSKMGYAEHLAAQAIEEAARAKRAPKQGTAADRNLVAAFDKLWRSGS